MQNTIVKEFANDPRVFTALLNQAGSWGETREWTEEFWSNYYLRGGILFDSLGGIGDSVFGQPDPTGIPFGRGFIIDRNGIVVLPYLGHLPNMVIAKIHEVVDAVTSVPEDARGVTIDRVHPSPFFASVSVDYTLASASHVDVRVYDVTGRIVQTLLDAHVPPGAHSVQWDARGAPAGVYRCVVSARGVRDVRTIVRLP